MAIPDGGQAFPVGEYGGMSLRDYFAGQVAGSLARELDPASGRPDLLTNQLPRLGLLAYAIADSMIAARHAPAAKRTNDDKGRG